VCVCSGDLELKKKKKKKMKGAPLHPPVLSSTRKIGSSPYSTSSPDTKITPALLTLCANLLPGAVGEVHYY